MEKFKQIFKHFLKPQFNEDDFKHLSSICKVGDIKALDTLFTLKKIKTKPLIKPTLKLAFEYACERGHFDIVEYLLTSPHTKHSFHNIHIENDYWVQETCLNGKTDIIKFLLSSPKLNTHADIFVDKIFMLACETLNFELIKFCTSSPELKNHAKSYLNNDAAFLSICNDYLNALSIKDKDPKDLTISMMFKLGMTTKKPYSNLDMIKNIIEYFVLDLNIPKSKTIENFLTTYHQQYLSTNDEYDYKKIIEKIFNMRDVKEFLNDGNQNNEFTPTSKRIKL
jgi:ankyrin repeat protein